MSFFVSVDALRALPSDKDYTDSNLRVSHKEWMAIFDAAESRETENSDELKDNLNRYFKPVRSKNLITPFKKIFFG